MNLKKPLILIKIPKELEVNKFLEARYVKDRNNLQRLEIVL